jgi:tetratricopeptide (TPR) repeat protein
MRAARLMRKGERQSKFGDYEGALEYYRMSLDYVIENYEPMVVYYCLAHSLAKLGRYGETREYVHRCLKDCERFAGLGQPVEELKRDVQEVLEYVKFKERQEKGG